MSVYQNIRETLAYCWNHCDNAEEEATFLWLAGRLAESLGDRYEFPDHRVGLKHVIDGPRGTAGTAPIVPMEACCDCGTVIEARLLGIGRCPSCVGKWVASRA